MIKIMIDAGHDGHRNASPCKTSKQYYESEAMFKLSQILKCLSDDRINFDLTRDNVNTVMDVDKRGQKAAGYDCFISLHTNAVGGGNVSEGTDRPAVIYPVGADESVKKLADQLAVACQTTIDTTQNYKNYSKAQSNGKDYYGVIRNAVAVGCMYSYIMEITFHTDTRATTWLLSDNNLTKLAKNIKNVLVDFFKKDVLYIVQCGAFSKYENAENRVKDLKNAGFDSIIKEQEK